jgi:hypothetical protein
VGAAEALGGSVDDGLENAVWIVIERVVPDAHHRPAFLLKEAVAPSVAQRFSMLAAIELDNQPGLATCEIGKVRADWKLTSEFRS